MEAGQKNIRLQQVVVLLAIVLFSVKVTAYFLTDSVAILTDALESIVNVVAGSFGLYSLYLSAKPRDHDHPYGHGKIEFISAAVEGTMILIAGLIIIYESVNNLFHPKLINQLDWGIALIGFTAVINYVTGYVCIKVGTKNNSIALTAGGKHLQTDTYSTIGIIVGLILIYFTHMLWLDSAVAIVFGGVIIFTGYKIVRKSIAGIMDESDTELLQRMVKLLNDNRKANQKENWIDLHNSRIIKFHALVYKAFDHFSLGGSRDWSSEFFHLYGNIKMESVKNEKEFEAKRVMNTRPTLPIEKYTGKYTDPLYGEIEITNNGNTLVFNVNNFVKASFDHWNYDTFRGWYNKKWYGKGNANFSLSVDGKVSKVNFDGIEFKKVE